MIEGNHFQKTTFCGAIMLLSAAIEKLFPKASSEFSTTGILESCLVRSGVTYYNPINL